MSLVQKDENMSDSPDTSSLMNWVLGSLITALGSVAATVVTLARYIESKFKSDIVELKADISLLKKENEECRLANQKCLEDRLAMTIRLNKIEALHDAKEKMKNAASQKGDHSS